MMLGGQILTRWKEFPMLLLISGVTCGIGFVLHELAHRMLARSYGAEAHFVADNGWLLLSILVAFAGMFIAAPGAVWHRGVQTQQQSGIIALAGPVTNMVLALLFFVPLVVFDLSGFWGTLFFVGYQINAWLGLFNMIPFGPFDGKKVLDWSQTAFGITIVIALVIVYGLGRLI
jgi:Zn-dependent protease